MQATFGTDGELKAVGKGAAPAVAEGLGAVNIKGVEDEKAQIDIEHEEGHPIVRDSPLVTGQGPCAGYDAGTSGTAMVDAPESGRITDAQGGTSIRSVEGAAYKGPVNKATN